MLTKIDIPHIECPALNVLAVLAAESSVSFGLALAGGAVRNAALGLPESDHDIIVFDFDAGTYTQLVGEIIHVLEAAGYNLTQIDDDEEYADARVHAVAQFRHDVYPELDVLFHPDDRSVQEVLRKHDYNINNYVAVVDDIADSERQTAYYVGTAPQGVLYRQPYQESICFDRQAHIVAIADKAGWSVPPRFRNSGSSHPDLFKG
jgi:tRNA nucleotidyltransferase/poly(A) polymerase